MILVAHQLALGLLGTLALFGALVFRGHDSEAIWALLGFIVWGALALTSGNVAVFNESTGEFVSLGSPTIQFVCLSAAAISAIALYGAVFHTATNEGVRA